MGDLTTLNLLGRRFEAPDPEPPNQNLQQRPHGAQAPPEKTAKEDKDERYDTLEREVSELRASNRQLVDLVGRGTQRSEAPDVAADVDIDWGEDEDEEDDEDEPEDPATLVEDLSKLGRDALAKRGFVRAKDVRKIVREESRRAATTAATQVVRQARTEVGRESAVIREFPDLADAGSELYKATAAHVRAAVALDPAAAKNPVTLYLAAKAATAELSGKRTAGKDRGSNNEPRDGDFDMEEEDREPVLRAPQRRTPRDQHIAAQSGDRGRGAKSRTARDDDAFVMTDEARDVAKQMGISTDDFAKEATRVRRAAGGGRRR